MPKNVEPLLLWLFAIYITSSMNYSCLLPIFSFFKNWSIVNLQCCVTSKCTAKWFSYTHIYFSTDSFPYRLLQDIEYRFLCCTSPYCLAILYVVVENPMDEGAWWAAVHGVAKSWTRLSDFTFTFHFHALEKEMAAHSSVLAWRLPGTGEPGGLPSMGSHRVGHDWSDLAAAAAVYIC